jgi:FAD/FMN-containing dehydrogenase
MDLLAELRNIIPNEDRIRVDGEEVERHGRAFSYQAPRSPDAVVFPKGKAEVVETLRFANVRGVPWCPTARHQLSRSASALLHGGCTRAVEFSACQMRSHVLPANTAF